ncbi:Bifunctional NMN adenylyltransferase/Nudix hydrolase [compost metagenome]
MSKKYQLAVFIGRMTPLHDAHLENIKHAASIADNVLVILGSANAPRDEKNPFTNDQREIMLCHATNGFTEPSNVRFELMNDMPSNELWAAEIMRLAGRHVWPADGKIAIVGHKKDESSFYLDLFPTWEFIETGAKMYGDAEMAATKIRELMFEGNFEDAKDMMPHSVWDYINANFIGSELFRNIMAEYRFHKSYPEIRRKKYPINDVTADAVVLCKSHILLIRRKNIPGKGQLALPGGFVQTDETVEDGALRELFEETKLHVPEKVLRKSIIDMKLFDNPKRSLRGRLMTFAHTFKIDTNHDGSLPRVYGSDDADKAFWVPIADIMKPEKAADFFEDHHSIIMTMIGRSAARN